MGNILFTLTKYPGGVSLDNIDILVLEGKKRKLDTKILLSISKKIDENWFPYCAVIDLQRLISLSENSNATLKSLVTLSRVKLQGTDGIRGKISTKEYTKKEALSLYLNTGVLTPAFFSLNAQAFALYLIEKKGIHKGDSIIMGEDGRDGLTHRMIVTGVIEGINSAGCKVLNTGIIPTPGVPYAACHWGCRGGIIITASHNPSNQNGIKLIHDNFKLMDDGEIGEFGLTKYIYSLAEENLPYNHVVKDIDISKKANKLLESTIQNNINFTDDFKEKAIVFYDGANGAFSKLAPKIFNQLPFKSFLFNVTALGHNINQDGGVGELEGTRTFEGRVDDITFNNYFPMIREIFMVGRDETDKKVFGIVNDGDGDRGYLLVYNREKDLIHVVPGDEVATLILSKRYYNDELEIGSIIVNSVEGDIMLSGYVIQKFGVKTITACVGDKWLLVPARQGLPLVVGCEESGHVTFGVDIVNSDNKLTTVYTGNGLLSILSVIEFVVKRNLDVNEIAHPFPPGHKAISYVYFVDKDKFLPGTLAFEQAGEIGLRFLKEKLAPLGLIVKIVPYSDAPEMLYIAAFDQDHVKVGALFVRNSGTESKTGTAIRCQSELKPIFEEAMNLVHNNNSLYLKDKEMLEAKQEELILEQLLSGPCSEDLLISLDTKLDQNNLDALTYAMKKQKMIKPMGNRVWEIHND